MEPIRGIIPPLVTPLNPSRRLDSTALHRLLDHLLTGGVHGLFALGTTGEAPCLDYATRREIIKLVCSHLDRKSVV